MATREEIVATARKWLGVRWKHQGRTVHGIDCVGLPAKVAHELGISQADYSNYPRSPIPSAFLEIFRRHLIEVRVAERQTGDILLLRDEKGRHLCHCGIQSEKDGAPHLIHAFAGLRQVVEEPITREMALRIIYAFRYPGIE